MILNRGEVALGSMETIKRSARTAVKPFEALNRDELTKAYAQIG
ncbi:hypothetical protein O9929_23105 [Vibrio lentus]|nr:hypothetical protein [Vibrio lentus]